MMGVIDCSGSVKELARRDRSTDHSTGLSSAHLAKPAGYYGESWDDIKPGLGIFYSRPVPPRLQKGPDSGENAEPGREINTASAAHTQDTGGQAPEPWSDSSLVVSDSTPPGGHASGVLTGAVVVFSGSRYKNERYPEQARSGFQVFDAFMNVLEVQNRDVPKPPFRKTSSSGTVPGSRNGQDAPAPGRRRRTGQIEGEKRTHTGRGTEQFRVSKSRRHKSGEPASATTACFQLAEIVSPSERGDTLQLGRGPREHSQYGSSFISSGPAGTSVSTSAIPGPSQVQSARGDRSRSSISSTLRSHHRPGAADHDTGAAAGGTTGAHQTRDPSADPTHRPTAQTLAPHRTPFWQMGRQDFGQAAREAVGVEGSLGRGSIPQPAGSPLAPAGRGSTTGPGYLHHSSRSHALDTVAASDPGAYYSDTQPSSTSEDQASSSGGDIERGLTSRPGQSPGNLQRSETAQRTRGTVRERMSLSNFLDSD